MLITENSDRVYVFDENGTSLYNFGSEAPAMDSSKSLRELHQFKWQ